MYTFFSTGPMIGGVGFFSDMLPVQLFMLSSVRHQRGHGGMTTRLGAVAEIDGKTGRVTFHLMLHGDEMFFYDKHAVDLSNSPVEEDKDRMETAPPPKDEQKTAGSKGKAVTKTASTSISKV